MPNYLLVQNQPGKLTQSILRLWQAVLLQVAVLQDSWEEKLPYLEMVYNSSPQSRTKESPHYVMVGRQLKFPADLDFSRATVPAATDNASEMQAVWERVRQ